MGFGNMFGGKTEEHDPRLGGKCDPDVGPMLSNTYITALDKDKRQH